MNFYREPHRRQRFLLPVDMSDRSPSRLMGGEITPHVPFGVLGGAFSNGLKTVRFK